MKKINLLSILLILFLLLALTSCDFLMGEDGKDGKAYLKVTIDSVAEAWYGYVEGFPSGWSLDTPYELNEGIHDVAYSLCYCYDHSDSYYYYRINSHDLSDWAVRKSSYISALDALINYLEEEGEHYVFTNTITIEENNGTSGGLFKDGKNGEDKYYSLYLAWDPDDSIISSNGVELEKTVIIGENNDTITQFIDEYRTFTLTFPEKSTTSELDANYTVRAVQ